MQQIQPLQSYGDALPGVDPAELHGRLIVIEGPDAVGRTTQVVQLRQWLEQEGHAVLDTGMARSALVGKGIQQAKQGNTLGPVTMTLFYTTDFADRLENEIIPALRAGFVVLTESAMPGILAEVSFVSSPTDEQKLRSDGYREQIAEALYKGIAKYAGGLSGVKVASKLSKPSGE